MAKEAAVAAEPQRFRVLHGAVAGTRRDKKGDLVDHDYYVNQIVREDQLDGHAPEYVALGAIAPLESPDPAPEAVEPPAGSQE